MTADCVAAKCSCCDPGHSRGKKKKGNPSRSLHAQQTKARHWYKGFPKCFRDVKDSLLYKPDAQKVILKVSVISFHLNHTCASLMVADAFKFLA